VRVWRQVLNADHGQVAIRVGAHELGEALLTVMVDHGDERCAADDMVIGHDVAVGVDDKARPGALARPRGALDGDLDIDHAGVEALIQGSQ